MKKSSLRIREKACHYAAIALSGRQDDERLCPMAWSLAVFFESYIVRGAMGTQKDFGPKKPAKLKAVLSSTPEGNGP